jgi:hypothetical protein
MRLPLVVGEGANIHASELFDILDHYPFVAARITAASRVADRRWNLILDDGVEVKLPENELEKAIQTLAELDQSEQIFERDIVTPSHRKLTLINPAYMTRQVHELEMEKTGVRGHITSLNPIRPENAPDQWEREALLAFQDGSDERSGVEVMEGQQYVRLMRPLITEKGCLKCHAVQGYKVGDIRGGISVAVPLAPYLAIQHRRLVFFFVTGGIIWLAGLIGIGTGGLMIRHQLHYRLAHEAELRNMAKLQGVLELSGAVCHELNQPIQAISGYSELMLMSMGNDNPLHRKASAIKQQVERMSTITAKLNSITHYASKDYSRRKIIDIDSASK